MIDTIIKRNGEQLPELAPNSMRYVIAENGMFLERRTAHFTTSCRVEHCGAGLQPHTNRCELHAPPIPAELARQMVAYFRYGYTLHGGEAALVLLYAPLEERYSWYCPRQTVEMWESWSGKWYGSPDIHYVDPLEIPAGMIAFGDAHSHANMPAYASAVDQKDEEHKDGLHIVVGNLHKHEVDLYADFVMDGQRFEVAPPDVFAIAGAAEVSQPATDAFPQEWRDCIEIIHKPYTPPSWYGGGSGGAGSHYGGGYGGGTTWGGAPGYNNSHDGTPESGYRGGEG